MTGQMIFVGALLLTLVAFLVLLVMNPKAFIDVAKQGQEQQKQSFDLMGKAIGGAASIAGRFLNRK